MQDAEISALVREVRQKLPKALWTDDAILIERDVHHIRLAYVPNGRAIDLGGGYSPTSVVLVKLGMEVTVVDTFSSTAFYDQFSEAEFRNLLSRLGVNVVKQDLLSYDPAANFAPESIDSVVSHDTLYFFNPRTLLEKCLGVLKPKGTFAANVNNAVSLPSRLRVMMGRTNIDLFDSYFFENVHKRYWTTGDLRRLAAYLRLTEATVYGRNWSLYHSFPSVPKSWLRLADSALRVNPNLCGNLYLVGKK